MLTVMLNAVCCVHISQHSMRWFRTVLYKSWTVTNTATATTAGAGAAAVWESGGLSERSQTNT